MSVSQLQSYSEYQENTVRFPQAFHANYGAKLYWFGAQIIVPNFNAVLNYVNIRLWRDPATTSGNASICIMDLDANNKPSNILATSGTINLMDVPLGGDGSLVQFTLEQAVSLVKGTGYAIVTKGDGLNAVNAVNALGHATIPYKYGSWAGQSASASPDTVTNWYSIGSTNTIGNFQLWGIPVNSIFPQSRPYAYNGDELYQYDSEAWVNPNEYGDTIAFGSGRHRNVLVAVSHGKVYFESV